METNNERTQARPADVPGSKMPEVKPLPNHPAWLTAIGCLAYPVAGLAAFTCAAVLFGKIEMGGIGFIVGLVLASWWSQDIKQMALSRAAKKQLKPRADVNPPDTDACVQLGLYLINTNPPGTPTSCEGEGYFRKVLAVEPNHRDARIALALSCNTRRAYKETVDVFSQWLPSNPDFIGEVTVGCALREINDHNQAVLHFREARKLSPSLSELSAFPSAGTKEAFEEYLKQYDKHG